MFPGEKILEDAKQFAENYLTQKREKNQLIDKWIIMKELPGEVCSLYYLIKRFAQNLEYINYFKPYM